MRRRRCRIHRFCCTSLFYLPYKTNQSPARHPGCHRGSVFALRCDGRQLDLKRLPPRLRPFVWLSGGRIRWQVVTRMLEAGYLDVAATCEPAPAPTFPAWGAHLRLDYAFVPRGLAAAVRAHRVITDAAEVLLASDHLPILVELDVAGLTVARAAEVGALHDGA